MEKVEWGEAEKFVWRKVCAGDAADFNVQYGTYLDPGRAEGLPDDRVLSSAFLRTIIDEERYRNALTRRGVRIIGADLRKNSSSTIWILSMNYGWTEVCLTTASSLAASNPPRRSAWKGRRSSGRPLWSQSLSIVIWYWTKETMART
jgi:hypothetical protein